MWCERHSTYVWYSSSIDKGFLFINKWALDTVEADVTASTSYPALEKDQDFVGWHFGIDWLKVLHIQ